MMKTDKSSLLFTLCLLTCNATHGAQQAESGSFDNQWEQFVQSDEYKNYAAHLGQPNIAQEWREHIERSTEKCDDSAEQEELKKEHLQGFELLIAVIDPTLFDEPSNDVFDEPKNPAPILSDLQRTYLYLEQKKAAIDQKLEIIEGEILDPATSPEYKKKLKDLENTLFETKQRTTQELEQVIANLSDSEAKRTKTC